MIYISSEEDLKVEGVKALYFYANWMPFNLRIKGVLENIEKKNDKIKFFAVDTDSFKSLCTRYSVKVVPTIVIVDVNSKTTPMIEGVAMASAIKSFFTKYDKGNK